MRAGQEAFLRSAHPACGHGCQSYHPIRMKTHLLYLGGAFVAGEGTVPVVNPATGQTIALMSTTSRSRVGTVLADAHEAFLLCRKLTGKARGEWLNKIATALEARKDEVARLITMENGKPLAQ